MNDNPRIFLLNPPTHPLTPLPALTNDPSQTQPSSYPQITSPDPAKDFVSPFPFLSYPLP